MPLTYTSGLLYCKHNNKYMIKKELRNKNLHLRLTETEHKELKKLAKKYNHKMAEIIYLWLQENLKIK